MHWKSSHTYVNLHRWLAEPSSPWQFVHSTLKSNPNHLKVNFERAHLAVALRGEGGGGGEEGEKEKSGGEERKEEERVQTQQSGLFPNKLSVERRGGLPLTTDLSMIWKMNGRRSR